MDPLAQNPWRRVLDSPLVDPRLPWLRGQQTPLTLKHLILWRELILPPGQPSTPPGAQ